MRKQIFLPLIVFIFSCIVEKNNNRVLTVRDDGIGFSIHFADALKINTTLYEFYDRAKAMNEMEKVHLIEELLSFERDTRTCSHSIVNYNKNLSQFYEGPTQRITIQVQALFLVNQVYFDNPFYYSPYSILISGSNELDVTNEQPHLDAVYKAYKSWFDYIKRNGIAAAKSKKMRPLDNTNYRWMHGIDIDPGQALQFDI